MVDVCNPQNHTNIKFLFYILPVIHFFSPRQTENQITARNAVVLFHSFFFLSLLNPQKYTQLELQLDFLKTQQNNSYLQHFCQISDNMGPLI